MVYLLYPSSLKANQVQYIVLRYPPSYSQKKRSFSNHQFLGETSGMTRSFDKSFAMNMVNRDFMMMPTLRERPKFIVFFNFACKYPSQRKWVLNFFKRNHPNKHVFSFQCLQLFFWLTWSIHIYNISSIIITRPDHWGCVVTASYSVNPKDPFLVYWPTFGWFWWQT